MTGIPNEDSKRTVLHDITDDAELIEVTTTSLGTEGLLECDLNHKGDNLANNQTVN